VLLVGFIVTRVECVVELCCIFLKVLCCPIIFSSLIYNVFYSFVVEFCHVWNMILDAN
jgi:hypothetical protein